VPPEARREYERGRAALSEKKSDKGIEHLEKAVKLYPEFFDAQFLIATTLMDAEQWDKAEKALRRSLEMNRAATAALVSLGEVERRLKKYAEAEKFLQEALRLDDQAWLGHYTLGRVYWEKNDIQRAGRHIGRTLELQPDFPEAHLLGGNIFMRAGLPANALVEYEEYLRLAPRGEFAVQTLELTQKLKKQLAETKK
jgi:tetratricopeptide (TPR) repeat protein